MLNREIGVLICSCRGKTGSKLNNVELNELCCQHPNISFINWVDELCLRPDLLKNMTGQVDGLLILGCTDQKHVDKWRDVMENTNLPIFACEFVDLKGLPADSSGEYVKLLINAYTAKILAGWEVASKAVPVGLAKMVEAIDKPAMNRRQFFRMSLKLGKYEEVPVINAENCLAARSNCQLCVDACSTRALIKHEGTICIKEDKCLKCGWCTVSCPFGCIQIPSFTGPAGLALLEGLAPGTAADNNLSLLISCGAGLEELNRLSRASFTHQPFIAVRVPSLASVSYLHIIRAVELGFSRIVFVCPGENCPRQESLSRWKSMMNFIKELLKTDDMEPPLELLITSDVDDVRILLNSKPANQPGYKRKVCKEFILSAKKDYRLQFAQCLEKLMEKSKGKNNKYYNSPLPFYCISINPELCSMCGSCWEKCPCQAITMENNPQGNLIKFSYIRCIGCRTCIANCAEQAITIDKVLDLDRLDRAENEILKTDELIKCRTCQKPIGTRSLIEKVNLDLINKGWTNNAEKIYYCSKCQVMDIENDLTKHCNVLN